MAAQIQQIAPPFFEYRFDDEWQSEMVTGTKNQGIAWFRLDNEAIEATRAGLVLGVLDMFPDQQANLYCGSLHCCTLHHSNSVQF